MRIFLDEENFKAKVKMSGAKNFIDPASLCSLCSMRLAVGMCAGCRCRKYCGKTCQKLDWIANKHRLRCKFLKSDGCALDKAEEKETEEDLFDFDEEEEDSESEESDVGMPKREREKEEKKKQKEKEPSSRRRKTEKEPEDEPGSLGKNEQKVIDTLLKSAKNPIPVSVSGAVAGEIVYGINANQTDGIEFEVVQGVVHRSKKLCDALGGDAGVVKLVSDRWHISLEASRARLAGIPAHVVDNAQPIGTAPKPGEKVDEQTAQLVLRSEGILGKSIDEVVNKAGGDREEISNAFNKLRTARQSFTAEDFLSALRGGTSRKSLVLHQSWYAVRPPKSSMSTTKAGAVVDLRGAGLGGAVPGAGFVAPADSEIFEIEVADASDSVAILVPKERPHERVPVGQMLELAKAVCADVAAPGEIDFVYDAFARRATDGQRRAAVQKAVRLGAKMVSFSCLGYGDRVVRTDVFACTTLATLFASAGSWNSDLKLTVRGCTSAFKRLAVMLFEDAWARGAPAAAFLAAALLAQNVSAWHPHKELVEQALRTCKDACNSTLVFRRHPGGTWPREDYEMRAPGREGASAKRGVKACKFKAVVPFRRPSNFEFQACAFLLAAVGSFAGDEMMVELFADQYTREPPKLRTLDGRPTQPLVMPIEHIVDQHAYVGVGHLIPGDASFTEKFNALFDPYAGVTGVNSRRLSPEYTELLRQSGGDFEAIPAVARHRPAQRATLILAHGLAPEADLAAQPKEFDVSDPLVENFPVVLSAGTLSAAVGPIMKVRPKFKGKEKKKIKSRELIVMLGTQKPEDEAVMLSPSRDPKSTEEGSYLYASVTPEEKEEAIRIARSKTFKLTAKNCPEYPQWKGLEVAYDAAKECWTVGGIPYETARLRAIKAGNAIHVVDVNIDIANARAEPAELAAALVRARKLKYPAVTIDAISRLDKLCVDTTVGALFRALALIKQQFQKVEFPKPARDGKQASDELMVFPQDAEAYIFMLCVSALYPGALKASDVPTFEIRDVQLLRWIENRIGELAVTRRVTSEREEILVAPVAAATAAPEERWQFRNPVSRSDESKVCLFLQNTEIFF